MESCGQIGSLSLSLCILQQVSRGCVGASERVTLCCVVAAVSQVSEGPSLMEGFKQESEKAEPERLYRNTKRFQCETIFMKQRGELIGLRPLSLPRKTFNLQNPPEQKCVQSLHPSISISYYSYSCSLI